MDAVIWGICAVVIGGVNGISNVCVGKFFDIFVLGIYVYVLVQVYGNDYEVFKVYAVIYKNCVFFVDIYDIFCIGVLAVIQVVCELGDQINFMGVWIDFGDIVYIFKKVCQ